MSKRKPATALRKTQSRKPAARAQRANQSVVRSPKPRRLRSFAPVSAEKVDRDAPVLEKAVTAISVASTEKPAIASRDDSQRSMKAFDLFSATTNVGAFRKLPEITLANMQLAFEFAQTLAQIKSPFEIPSVFAKLAAQQLTIFQRLLILNQSSR